MCKKEVLSTLTIYDKKYKLYGVNWQILEFMKKSRNIFFLDEKIVWHFVSFEETFPDEQWVFFPKYIIHIGNNTW